MSRLSARTESRIMHAFETFIEREPVAEVYSSTMIYRCFQHLTDDPERMRRPDVSVVRRERFLALGDANPGQLRIPPDLVVEVVSTHDLAADIDEKVSDYQGAGVPLVWVVYPIPRRVVTFPLSADPSIWTDRHTLTAAPVLPGFACRVSDLFPRRP